MPKFWLECLSGRTEFQGKNSRFGLVDACSWSASPSGRGRRRRGGCRIRRTAPGAGLEVGRHLPGVRVRVNDPTSFAWIPNPSSDHEQPVLVAGLRFADVERAGQRRRRAPACRSRRCRSSSCRGSWPGPRSRSWPGRRCRRVWPSAASGLTVRPSGRVTIADLISEGDARESERTAARSG